jgi:hypothetical protein
VDDARERLEVLREPLDEERERLDDDDARERLDDDERERDELARPPLRRSAAGISSRATLFVRVAI